MLDKVFFKITGSKKNAVKIDAVSVIMIVVLIGAIYFQMVQLSIKSIGTNIAIVVRVHATILKE